MANATLTNPAATKSPTQGQERKLSPQELRWFLENESLEYDRPVPQKPSPNEKLVDQARGILGIKPDNYQRDVEARDRVYTGQGFITIDSASGSFTINPDTPPSITSSTTEQKSVQFDLPGFEVQTQPLSPVSSDTKTPINLDTKGMNDKFAQLMGGFGGVAETTVQKTEQVLQKTVSASKDLGDAGWDLIKNVAGIEPKPIDPKAKEKKDAEVAHLRNQLARMAQEAQRSQTQESKQSIELQQRELGGQASEQDIKLIGINEHYALANIAKNPKLIFDIRIKRQEIQQAQEKAKKDQQPIAPKGKAPQGIFGADMNRNNENQNMTGNVG